MTNELTVDAMILALVERHGFTLPEGLRRVPPSFLQEEYTEWQLNGLWLVPESAFAAHDLCACHFARTASPHLFGVETGDAFVFAMQAGDSAAAIRALFDAMEAK